MAWPRVVPFVLLVVVVSATSAFAEPTRREKGDHAIQARAILRKYCSDCHNGGEKNRGRMIALDHARLVAGGPNPVPFVSPGNVAGSQIIQFIEEGSMPPGGRPRPQPDEIESLKQWIAESATSFPAAFDEATTLRVMLNDLATQPEEAAPYLRYFSLAHLIHEDAKLPNLATAERELQQALLRAGAIAPGQPPPVPVDGTATLFRFDIRPAGWDSNALFVKVAKGAEGLFPLTPYDVLLLEYPHAAAMPPTDPLAKPLRDYLAKAKLARPVPFLQGDWVAASLKPGSPLADDLKSLTELHGELQKQKFPASGGEKNMPCGPKPHAFGGLNPVPAAAKAQPDRPVLPLGAWYSGDCQIEPPPFTLTAEVVGDDDKPLKSVLKGEPFRLKVTTNRDIRFVLLMVWSNGEVRVQETRQDGFLKAGEQFLVPKDAERFRIADILTGAPKATEYFVLLASEKELPQPVIVRSRHARNGECDEQKRFPIFRFLLDPDEKVDQSRVVRRVVPVTVTAKKAD